MTVKEAQSRIDSGEFAGWLAYERVAGPLGGERGDLQAAIVAATVHNLWAKKPRKLRDFFPTWARRKQSDEEMLAWAKTLNRAFGGTEVRPDGDDRGFDGPYRGG